MASLTGTAPTAHRRAAWPSWAGYLAALWSFVIGGLGLYWTLGGGGFPFGVGDPHPEYSILGSLRPAAGGPAIAVLGLAGVLVALVMVRTRALGTAPLVFAWGQAALAILVCDYRVLAMAAYTIVFLVGAPFHWPPVDFWSLVGRTVPAEYACLTGAALWAATAVAYRRQARNACPSCGRTAAGEGWTTPAAAARWGRWAVAVAVALPLLYALVRYAWLLGIPLGISEALLRDGQRSGEWVAGAALASVAVGGALLTLGLVQRWGEEFPRWVPFLGGRRVPIRLATIPASLTALLILTAGTTDWRLVVSGRFGLADWATVGPSLTWPLWAAALGAAALAYHLRRRGSCPRCGRG